MMTPAQTPSIRILVTGFGRYPGVRVNPTAALMRRVVARLNRSGRAGMARGGELTVSYARARHELDALLTAWTPDAMLLLGLAARARCVRIERHGRRLDSRLHPDSAGAAGQAHAARSDIPLNATGLIQPALHAALRRGIRARLSPSAGRYLCNAVYASALEKAAGRPVLFVHVPFPRGWQGSRRRRPGIDWRPSMLQLERALADIATGLALQARRSRMARHGMA